VSEDNNDPGHLQHDVRLLRLHVVVFSEPGETTLSEETDDTQTTIPVSDVVSAHNSGTIRIENPNGHEFVRYDSVSEDGLAFEDCTRGVDGTQALAHAQGSVVRYSSTTPAISRAGVEEHLDAVDERLAQATIRLRRPVPIDIGGNLDTGRALPPALLDGVTVNSGFVTTFTMDELAMIALKDGDANSVDVFYVDSYTGSPTVMEAYPEVRNQSGVPAGENFVVARTNATYQNSVLAHEMMHILLNAPHRNGEPSTALFRSLQVGGVAGTKRIGPYPDAQAAGVGYDDSETIRGTAEILP